MRRRSGYCLLGGVALACASSGSGPGSGEKQLWRANAVYPYVRYFDGSPAEGVDARIDLDDASFRVGTGCVSTQTVRQGSLELADRDEGRRLFTPERMHRYTTLSQERGAGGGAESKGAVGSTTDAGLATPAPSCDNTNPETSVWLYPEPGTRSLHLRFSAAARSDQEVDEMLAYLARIARSYEP
jgi:hypothetical protein